MLTREAVVIVSPQIAEWNVVLEDVSNNREDGVGHGDGSAVFAPLGSNTLILCVKVTNECIIKRPQFQRAFF